MTPPLSSEKEWLKLDARRIELENALAAIRQTLLEFNPFAPNYEPLTRKRFDNLLSRLKAQTSDPFAVWLSTEVIDPDSPLYGPLPASLRTVWDAAKEHNQNQK